MNKFKTLTNLNQKNGVKLCRKMYLLPNQYSHLFCLLPFGHCPSIHYFNSLTQYYVMTSHQSIFFSFYLTSVAAAGIEDKQRFNFCLAAMLPKFGHKQPRLLQKIIKIDTLQKKCRKIPGRHKNVSNSLVGKI